MRFDSSPFPRYAARRVAGVKAQARLLEMLEMPHRMTRGRLCVLSRNAKGGMFYHLQYRKNTKLFQRYIHLGEVTAYEESTEQFRLFMSVVDADSPRRATLRLDAAADGRNRARHQPRHDHSELTAGCWLLAVGHCRRKKRIPAPPGGGILFDASVLLPG